MTKEKAISMKKTLDTLVEADILSEIDVGYSFKKNGDYTTAEKHYLAAWDKFPKPKFEWSGCQITIYNIVDFYLEWKNFAKALEWANLVFKTDVLPGDATPYVVIGKIKYEAGDLDAAFEKFDKAFSIAKSRGFEGEDRKYLNFYKNHGKGK